MFIKVTLIIGIICVHLIYASEIPSTNEDVQEVDEGSNTILHCKSNDATHNFMFWHGLRSGIVIGPRNDFNNYKFDYEVLSGNLTIKDVTSNEADVYTCVSNGVDKQDIWVHSIKLVIKEDWEELLEYDHNGNLWKTSAVLGCILLILIIILVALHIYHKEAEKPRYFDIIEQNDEDEDSTEELFTREPSTSGTKQGFENNGASDNFQKVYTAINMNTS